MNPDMPSIPSIEFREAIAFLKDVKGILERDGWIQNRFRVDKEDETPVNPAGLCLSGAFYEVLYRIQDRRSTCNAGSAAYLKAIVALRNAIKERTDLSEHLVRNTALVIRWNDEEGRTKEDIFDVIEKAELNLAKEMLVNQILGTINRSEGDPE